MRTGNYLGMMACAGLLFVGAGQAIAGDDDDDERRHRHGIQLPAPVTDADYYDEGSPDSKKVELGQLLFFDKILSGNHNISCATCHHPLADTGDGLSLPVGEGGLGLGVTRNTGLEEEAIGERVPRNAPHIFNLGAKQFERMFHDGRATIDPGAPSGFLSPAGDSLPVGLDNVLAVQAMFPVTSAAEMAGQAGENTDVGAPAAAGDLEEVWAALAARLRDIPEYVEIFADVYDDVVGPEDITYVHAANAIAAFEATAWRADNSPFDRFLRGEKGAMSPEAKRGMRLFYGRAGCATCHSGKFQTDQDFHAVAMPQIGPGKGDNQDGYADGLDDFGRERVTGEAQDRFRFRTPTLRNVALTAPYGHAGAYDSLRLAVEHHLDPAGSLMDYWETHGTDQAVLPSAGDAVLHDDFVVVQDPDRLEQIAYANELAPSELSERELDQIMAFLQALTDPSMLDLRSDVPDSVPSGLPVFD